MSTRLWLALVGLALAAFIMNTSEFMPIGLLTSIAAQFRMTETAAGTIVSLYAWAVAVFSIPLMVFASRFPLKGLLLGVIVLFAAGQAICALAPTFAVLVSGRLVVAAAHAVFWAIVSPIAVYVVGDRYKELAIGTITTGSSVAMVCGLPLGRVVGLVLGWRTTFAGVAVLALLVLAVIAVAVPPLRHRDRFSARELPRLLGVSALRGLYLVTVLFATAHFTGYSYIEPFLQQVAGFSQDMTTFALVLFGCAGVVGSVLFSRVYAKTRLVFLRVCTIGVVLVLALLLPASGTVPTALALCMLWGGFYTSFNVAFQTEVIVNAPRATSSVAMAAYSGIFNLGIGCGTLVGGQVAAIVSLAGVGFVGAGIGTVAFAACAGLFVRAVKRASARGR